MGMRMAVPGDSAALLSIYREYIQTPITFEYELPSQEEFTHRILSTLACYPYLVWEEQGTPVGYAYAHRLGERDAYQWNAELSIYLSTAICRGGVGQRPYAALMELLRLQGVKTVCGIVTSPNPASEGLHRAMGFRLVGTRKHAGYKNGVWLDVLWFEKSISPHGSNPSPVIPISQLPREALQAVLDQFSLP